MAQAYFFDGNVSGIEQLLPGLPTDALVFTLNIHEDGLMQMARSLTGITDLDAIHVVSHGAAGMLQLGSSLLNANNIDAYMTPLADIGLALSSTGDLLLYGCNVGLGETGQTIIKQLATHIGADVAASTDLTGMSSSGGNAALELVVGPMETTPLLQTAALSTPLAITTTANFADLIAAKDGLGGFYSTFAEFSQAAYHLHEFENLGNGINFKKAYADDAFQHVSSQWSILNGSDLGAWSGINTQDSDSVWSIAADGIYTCDNAAAFAAVCGDALVISFRGTNDNDIDGHGTPDELNWLDMSGHYDELRPFVNAVDSYAANHNLSKVYVTGHSLGGGMALGYMTEHPDLEQVIATGNGTTRFTADGTPIKYEAVTFAAPGYIGDADAILGASAILSPLTGFFSAVTLNLLAAQAISMAAFDPRIVGIEIEGDLVPDAKFAHGYTVSVNPIDLQHTRMPTAGNDYVIGDDYGTFELHSMGLYTAAARSFDTELWRTEFSDADWAHGFARGLFSENDNGLYGLSVSEVMQEAYPAAPQQSASGDNVPRYIAGIGNNILGDTSEFGYTDYFIGGSGADTLGGPAYLNDPLALETSVAVGSFMSGGDGNDVFLVDSVGDMVYEKIGAGTDQVNSDINYRLGDNVEHLVLNQDSGFAWFDRNLIGIGNELDNRITGNNGNNHISGLTGSDTLVAGLGDDVLEGGAGNDILKAEDGFDSLIGGDGNDQYLVSRVSYDPIISINVPTYQITESSGDNDTLYIIDTPKSNALKGFSDLNIKAVGLDLWIDLDIVGRILNDDDEGRIIIHGAGTAAGRVETLVLTDSSGRPLEHTISLESVWNAALSYGDGAYHRINLSQNYGIYGTLALSSAGAVLPDQGAAGAGFDNWFFGTNPASTPVAISGNDLLTGTGGADGFVGSLGRDTLEGGSGIDKLIVDVDMTGFTSNITYGLGAVTLGYDATFNAVNAALANAPTRWQLNLSASST
ncbi:MAG: hypothetical protein RLZZ584_1141 [Pseudomonadota bacterium]